MQQEKNNALKRILCYLPALICMAVIFWLSSRNAEESAQQSGIVLEWLISIFGDNILTDFIVRKLAHCLEFTGLCILFNLGFVLDGKKLMIIQSILLTSAYAATDEFHQLFVSGRSCELKDWAIDTCGAVIGSIVFAVIYKAVKRIAQKRSKKAIQH